MNYKEAKEAHKAKAPYKTALDAVNSPTFSAMHKLRKQEDQAKGKALKKMCK